MNEAIYTVKGMHCQSCVANVREMVTEVPGFEAVEVDLPTEKVVVRGDTFEDGAVRRAIAEAGYQTA